MYIHTWMMASAVVMVAGALGGCATDDAYVRQISELERRVKSLEAKYIVAANRYDEIDRLGQMSYALQNRMEALGVEQARQQTQMKKLSGAAPQAQPQSQIIYKDQPSADQVRGTNAASMGSRPSQGQVNRRVGAQELEPASKFDGTVQELYSKAYQQLGDGFYKESQAKFGYILQQWPKDELADNALYWLGEIDYKKGRWIEALKKFESVVELYPAGNKVPDAILKQALCWDKLGDQLKSEQVANKLIKEYSWSPAAEKAQTMIRGETQ